MEPKDEEIEAVGEALIVLNQGIYTDEQLEEMSRFLRSYLKIYNKSAFNTLFQTSPEILQAVEVLYQFSKKYHANTEIMSDLCLEVDDLLINLNEPPGSISL